MKRWPKWGVLVLVAIAVAGAAAWYLTRPEPEPPGIASGNGRIEAVEIDIAAKTAGRVAEILVEEGELVTAGQVVARMDTETLQAQLRQAQAQLLQAKSSVAVAQSQVAQLESERAAAQALLVQREAERNLAAKRAQRSAALSAEGAISQQEADDDQARLQTAEAAIVAARAQVAAAEAAVRTGRAQVEGAEASVRAIEATIERIQAEITDSELRAPRTGRIQYRVAQLGEVVGAGGRVLNMIDLNDVYMTFFLPTAAVGRISVGAEARIVLDAFPQYVIPAQISYISDIAQFTPKTVETRTEREKLMFRVRASIPRPLLEKYVAHVKTGLPGVAYVRLDPAADWPPELEKGLVQ